MSDPVLALEAGTVGFLLGLVTLAAILAALCWQDDLWKKDAALAPRVAEEAARPPADEKYTKDIDASAQRGKGPAGRRQVPYRDAKAIVAGLGHPPPEFEPDTVGGGRWHVNGLNHLVGAPAVVTRSGTYQYHQYGELHREDGPAVEEWNGDRVWFLEGVRVGRAPSCEHRMNACYEEVIHAMSSRGDVARIAEPLELLDELIMGDEEFNAATAHLYHGRTQPREPLPPLPEMVPEEKVAAASTGDPSSWSF